MSKLYIAALPLDLKRVYFSKYLLDILNLAELFVGEERKTVFKIFSLLENRDKKYMLLNEHSTVSDKLNILNNIKSYKISCLFSDTGAPCVADPGYDLVDLCYKENITIISVPGPSSITAGLSVSGFYAESFSFFGYPPRIKNKRRIFFQRIAKAYETVVFIERPYVMKKLVSELDIIKGKRLSISYNLGLREEKTIRGYINDIKKDLEEMPKVPFIIVVEGKGGTSRVVK